MRVTVVSGVEGPSVYINDHRIAGNKPWGGGTVIAEAEARPIDIAIALVGMPHVRTEASPRGDAATWHVERETKAAPILADLIRNLLLDDALDRWQARRFLVATEEGT